MSPSKRGLGVYLPNFTVFCLVSVYYLTYSLKLANIVRKYKLTTITWKLSQNTIQKLLV